MNYLNYVNSKDIREYLKKIDYKCSPVEAAWLVYQNRNATLDEKHAAWQEIIDTMPDCTVDWWRWCAPRESLHQFMRDYMALEKRWLKEFYENENAVYQYKLFGEDWADGKKSKCVFSSAEVCLAAAKEAGDDFGDFTVGITKRRLDNVNEYSGMHAFYRKDGAVMSVFNGHIESEAEYYLSHESFNVLWFAFPVPFQKGDIVWNPRWPNDDAAVVRNTTPDHYAAIGRKGCDTSDMNVWGYFQDDNGGIYAEVEGNYMDFEYYPQEKLTGRRRIMKALGNFMKGEIDVELFARAYHQILMEEDAKDCMPGDCTEEGLRLAGLMEEK